MISSQLQLGNTSRERGRTATARSCRTSSLLKTSSLCPLLLLKAAVVGPAARGVDNAQRGTVEDEAKIDSPTDPLVGTAVETPKGVRAVDQSVVVVKARKGAARETEALADPHPLVLLTEVLEDAARKGAVKETRKVRRRCQTRIKRKYSVSFSSKGNATGVIVAPGVTIVASLPQPLTPITPLTLILTALPKGNAARAEIRRTSLTRTRTKEGSPRKEQSQLSCSLLLHLPYLLFLLNP